MEKKWALICMRQYRRSREKSSILPRKKTGRARYVAGCQLLQLVSSPSLFASGSITLGGKPLTLLTATLRIDRQKKEERKEKKKKEVKFFSLGFLTSRCDCCGASTQLQQLSQASIVAYKKLAHFILTIPDTEGSRLKTGIKKNIQQTSLTNQYIKE